MDHINQDHLVELRGKLRQGNVMQQPGTQNGGPAAVCRKESRAQYQIARALQMGRPVGGAPLVTCLHLGGGRVKPEFPHVIRGHVRYGVKNVGFQIGGNQFLGGRRRGALGASDGGEDSAG